MITLPELLETSAALHRHLCPRQVLGVRMGMLAGEVLALALPQTDKRLYVVAETDGCAVDGISVATNCWVGRRTLRLEDFGKVAATFIDRQTGRAVRIAPQPGCREQARACAPEAVNKWAAQLLGYQRMPAEALLSVQAVQLKVSVAQWVSRPGVKVVCEMCGEEIMNERERVADGQVLCRACAGESYYWLTAEFPAWAGRHSDCLAVQ